MDKGKSFLKGLSDKVGKIVEQGTNTVKDVSQKVTEYKDKGKETIQTKLDVNNDGTVDLADFIIMGLRVPGVAVNRESFLKTEFMKTFDESTIQRAIDSTPGLAGIPVEKIDKLADDVISYERTYATGTSTALGIPGGAAMIATIPGDIVQFYGFMLRACQKLLYLYGFQQIDVSENQVQFDSETMNMLTLCLGVMFGVTGANQALKTVANALAKGVEKQLIKKALTKGTIYPMIKRIAKWFSINMTKKMFAGFFRKAIPVVGGVISGGMTYLSFGPCCNKLKESLRDTRLSNPYSTQPIEVDIEDYVAPDDDILEE